MSLASADDERAGVQLTNVDQPLGAKGVHVFVPVTSATTEEFAAATRALAARAERLDPALATRAFVRDDSAAPGDFTVRTVPGGSTAPIRGPSGENGEQP